MYGRETYTVILHMVLTTPEYYVMHVSNCIQSRQSGLCLNISLSFTTKFLNMQE